MSSDVKVKETWSDCSCTKTLGDSYDEKPGIPFDGRSDDIYHICPMCKRKWWQFNLRFHLWKHVTDESEWQSLGSN